MKLISVNIQNQDLPTAIRTIAQAAGLQADIGPGVTGTAATMSFTDMPLGQVLTNLLGKQTRLIEYKIENNRLRVFTDDVDAGSTITAAPAINRLSDYFPLASDKAARDMVDVVRRTVQGVEVTADDRLNVLFVRGSAEDLEKVRNLLRNVLAK